MAIKLIEFEKIKGAIQKRLIKNEMRHLKEVREEANILRLHEIITTK